MFTEATPLELSALITGASVIVLMLAVAAAGAIRR